MSMNTGKHLRRFFGAGSIVGNMERDFMKTESRKEVLDRLNKEADDSGTHTIPQNELCGTIYELRKLANAQEEIIEKMKEALTECDEAMGYMSEYDIPLCMPDKVKAALVLANTPYGSKV